jgi:peptidoglycan-associated lipoprotein
MKIRPLFLLAAVATAACFFQSCTRTGSDVWEDTKSAGRHVSRGARALGGKQGDSRQIHSRRDFEYLDDGGFYPDSGCQNFDYPDSYTTVSDGDFIPLDDPSNELMVADMISRPPRENPGEPGSPIPGIQAFHDPSTHPELAGIFHPIYFEYNSSLIKGTYNLQALHAIVDFLRSHPHI